ncbi:MAG: pyrroloquinoline quinone-dependent dehydrogenase [Vicinamibacterales bacterium]
MRPSVRFLILIGITASAVAGVRSLRAQSAPADTEWRTYGGDLASRRYAPLDQVHGGNFSNLQVAWRFKTDNLGPRPEFNLQATPLVVGGTMYSTGGSRRAAFALDARTGELRWMHSLDEGARGQAAPRQLSGRGLAHWTDGRSDERILYVTPGYRLIALNAKTGVPIPTFGTGGIVDLRTDADQPVDLEKGDIGLQAAPVVAGNTIIIGAAHLTGRVPVSMTNTKGYIRGYDVRTGRRLWTFHTIPRPGEFGNDTWEGDSWSYTGNAGVWAQMTVDEELGLVYLPVETPTGDEYGGHRHGNNLFAESLVALDLKTGQRKWHFQFIHHGIWDWDVPCAPILADITVDGRRIKAIAQPTKQGWVYVFDRATGQPVWPIVEKPVPQSDVPGEKTSPTQPFPTRPPAFERQGVSEDDLIDFTPALRAEALQVIARYKIGPIFTPPVVSDPNGTLGILMLPATTGGANWQGGSLDPETNLLYVFSNTEIAPLGLLQDPKRSDMRYVEGIARPAGSAGGGDEGRALSVQRLPLVKPPWGRITAVDLNRGDIAWQIAHGETPDTIRNHPALKGLTIPRTGRQGRIGTLVTKSLVIAGEGGFGPTPSGARGAMLRAYDKATGQEKGAVYMPAPQTGSPMTYMRGGRQFVVVAVSGAGYSGELLAYTLP